MGIALGFILGPFLFSTLVGIFFKLTLDAFSDAIYKKPFKYLSWPLTILFIIILSLVTFQYAQGVWSIPNTEKLTSFQSLFSKVMDWSTIIGIFILPVLMVYGIIKDVFVTKKTTSNEMNVPQSEEGIITASIKKKWLGVWFITLFIYIALNAFYDVYLHNAYWPDELLELFPVSLLVGLIALPIVGICFRVHVYFRTRK